MAQESDDKIRFHPTSGRIMGTLAVIAALAVVVVGVFDRGGVPAPVLAGALLFAVLAWASMLRPRVSVTSDDLVLQTMVEEISLPLAAIEDLAVRQMLVVRVGEKRYVSTALGKSWRKAMKGDKPRPRKASTKAVTEMPYDVYVEDEIRNRMESARAKAGVALFSDDQLALAAGVRRERAWLPIALIGVALLAFVVCFGALTWHPPLHARITRGHALPPPGPSARRLPLGIRRSAVLGARRPPRAHPTTVSGWQDAALSVAAGEVAHFRVAVRTGGRHVTRSVRLQVRPADGGGWDSTAWRRTSPSGRLKLSWTAPGAGARVDAATGATRRRSEVALHTCPRRRGERRPAGPPGLRAGGAAADQRGAVRGADVWG